MTKAPTRTMRPASQDGENTGTQAERGGENDTRHPEADTGTVQPGPATAAATGDALVDAEMRSAERAVLGKTPATGDPTPAERPEAMEGTRSTGPAATDAAAIMSAGGRHDAGELRAALPENFGQPSDRDELMRQMGEYEPEELAGLLLDRSGSLVRHTSGLWGAPDDIATATSTGNTAPASTITDVVVSKMIADGKARETETLRGRPRTIVRVETSKADDAPNDENATASTSPS